MEQHLQRAHLLYESKRYDRALKELQAVLARDPHDTRAHACAALCRLHLGQDSRALSEARAAVESDPQGDHAWYVLAFVEQRLRRQEEAEKAIEEARRLNPQEAEYIGLAALLRLRRKRWDEALRLAESGLQIDPENQACAHARARALLRLGRTDEARHYLATQLAQDPEDPLSLAHMGWTALEQGDRKAALTAFREALRLDAELEWARIGMVEALRSGVPFYRFVLRYHLQMESLNEEERWALVVGESYLAQFITVVGCSTVVLFPLTLLYLTVRSVFIYLTWAMRPLTGLFLRLHPFGRYCLDGDEKREAAWALPGVLGLVGTAAMAVVRPSVAWPVGMLVSLYAVSGAGAVFSVPSGWPRWLVALVALAYQGLGVLTTALLLVSPWHWTSWLLLVVFLWARHLVTLTATVAGVFATPSGTSPGPRDR